MQQSEESHKPKLKPLLTVTYDPRLPNLQTVQGKHWRSMTQDAYLKSVLLQPPLTAFRRQNNISDFQQKKTPTLKYISLEVE